MILLSRTDYSATALESPDRMQERASEILTYAVVLLGYQIIPKQHVLLKLDWVAYDRLHKRE
jgi:hypothetical protein